MSPPLSRSGRVLEMTGIVDANSPTGDGWYVDNPEGPTIGGRSVASAFQEAFGTYSLDRCVVMLAHGGDQSLYEGSAWAMEGDHGYSSLTPGSGADIWVGGSEEGRSTDLREKLVELDGQTVHLRIDDGR